jgi:sulfide dehydrogenase [flavocytochrome c] flavoprotein chain
VGMIGRRRFLLSGGGAVAAAAAARRPWARAAAAAASPHVVIVGGGFAGGCCALELRRLSPSTAVTLIDANSSYVTCPMSDAVITELRTMSSVTSTRAGIERAGVRLVHDAVVHVEADKRRVRLRGGAVVAYDKLVVAPGIRFLFGEPEGYDEAATQLMPHAWQGGPQTRLLAAQLHGIRDGATLALAIPPGLMRCPPGPYERASLIAYWLQQHRRRCKVLIFDSNNHFPRQDVFTDVWKQRYPGLIEWIPPTEGGAITRVDAATQTLFSSSGAHRVAIANVIPRQAPGQLATEVGLASGHGWCPVKPATFESQLVDGIHVIGDACIAGTMPKSASAACSQALHCAAAIAAQLAGRHSGAATDLDSVCYSMVGPQQAIVMRARFDLNDGEIVQAPSDTPARESLLEPTRAAEAWYARMRAQCFGDDEAGTKRSADA